MTLISDPAVSDTTPAATAKGMPYLGDVHVEGLIGFDGLAVRPSDGNGQVLHPSGRRTPCAVQRSHADGTRHRCHLCNNNNNIHSNNRGDKHNINYNYNYNNNNNYYYYYYYYYYY